MITFPTWSGLLPFRKSKSPRMAARCPYPIPWLDKHSSLVGLWPVRFRGHLNWFVFWPFFSGLLARRRPA